MNRAKLIRLSLRLTNSLSSTRRPGLHSLSLNQVTHFSHLTRSPPVFHSIKPPTFCNFPNSHQNIYFSSKPHSFIDLILLNEWSEQIENELEKLNPQLTHESVVFVLMKLNRNPRKSLDFFKWVGDRKGFEPSYLPYSLLLRSLACKEFINEFWDVASEMKGKGFCIDKQVYLTVNGALKRENLDKEAVGWTKFYQMMSEVNDGNDVAKDVVEVILGSDWNEALEGKLKKKLKFPLSENFLLTVFRQLTTQPLRALKFFKWVESCQGYDHNSVTYNGMARVLAQRETMVEFWDLVKGMRTKGYEIDIDTYIKISRRLQNNDAVELFEFMMDGPYKPSEQDCTLLLKSLSYDSEPDIDLVLRVINKYTDVGNTLTKAIYDGLHRSLCKVGRLDEAKKVVEDMKHAGYKPDNITYSQEVFGLCKQRRFEDACLVLDHMNANGCTPDIKTWTILVQGYCVDGQVDQALSCFAKMLEENVNPDADLLEVLIDGFLLHNKLIGGYKFLTEMVNKAHLKPWQATYKLMIEKLLESGKLEEAFNLLSMMKQQNYPPFPEPFVRYIAKHGTVDDAKKFLRALPVKSSPSTAAYVHVIRSFFEEGRHSEAKDLLYGSPYRVRTQKTIRNLFGSDQLS